MIDLASHPDVLELQRVVHRLALISHAPTQSYEFAPSENGRGDRWRKSDARAPIPHLGQHQSKSGGTRTPTGSIDVRGDMTPDYRQKSAVYFEKRSAGLARRWDKSLTMSDDGERVLAIQLAILTDLSSLLKEAHDTLDAWQRTPEVAGVEPERGSFVWKCRIAEDGRDMPTIKRVYMVSEATVYRYRAKYKGLRKVAA